MMFQPDAWVNAHPMKLPLGLALGRSVFVARVVAFLAAEPVITRRAWPPRRARHGT